VRLLRFLTKQLATYIHAGQVKQNAMQVELPRPGYILLAALLPRGAGSLSDPPNVPYTEALRAESQIAVIS